MINEIHKAFDDPNSLEVRAVFLDISKAFDKVWHDGLIFKLTQNGISGNLLLFFKNYLQNRKQRVVINSSASNYSSIESGVPQGSVLGPLLFLIYINDLEVGIESNIKFFADDTMLYNVCHDANMIASKLNKDLKTIQEWAYQWKMVFNPDPTKQANEILFSRRRSQVNHPELFFNNSVVSKVNAHKHLGLILQNDLSFDKHVEEKIRKARKTIGIMKQLSSILPLGALIQIYKAYARSHFDYCDFIYHIPPKLTESGLALHSLMEKIEKIQYQAALAVTGCWQGTSRNKIFEELGWETLSDRRRSRRILQIHKIITNMTPAYLRDLLPPNRQLFLPNVFREIRCRTDKYHNSFFPDAISTWNEITTHFNRLPSRKEIQKHLVALFRPKFRPIFNLHDPGSLRYIFQLRTGLSSLRLHKKQHNFIDTPSDICLCRQDVEDTNHYLTQCTFYAHARIKLISAINMIFLNKNIVFDGNDTSLYLYGHTSLSDAENKELLRCTLRYIDETKRFVKF